MKNNKGYTLVELLVAMAIFSIVMLEIFAMMNQSSKLYLNGTYEVELQAEAQQIVQQMEELLIDANVSVNIIPGVSVDSIEIVNHDVKYLVEYEEIPSVSYGNLLLTTEYLDGSGYTETGVLMAEYVQSISLNMDEYNTTSRVVLNVVMRNNKYSYSTSKDIYLRNNIGVSGNGAGHAATGAYDEELDVLRFKDYNLSNLYGFGSSEYSFRWAAESKANSCETYYNLRLVGSSWMLETKPVLDRNYAMVGGDYLIEVVEGTNPDVGDALYTIKVYTNPLRIGITGGYGIFLLEASADTPHMSMIPIDGVYVGAATKISWTFKTVGTDQDTAPDGWAHRVLNANGTKEGFTASFNNEAYLYYNGVIDGHLFRPNRLDGQLDLESNAIRFDSAKCEGYGNFYGLLDYGGMIVMEIELEFSTIATGNDGNVIVIAYPFVINGTSMTNAQETAFWNYCNAHSSPRSY